MKKLYVCPFCSSEHIYADSYEDGGGDYGEQITGLYVCDDCGMHCSEDEAFWGYEGEPDDNTDAEIPFNEINARDGENRE